MASLRKKRASKCALCDATTGLNLHHIKPRSLGGKDEDDNLITLCEFHHEQQHSTDPATSISTLTKIGIAKAQERGVVFGNRINLREAGQKGRAAIKARTDAFAQRFRPMIDRLRRSGMSFREIAEQFNLMGIPTAQSGSWHVSTVSNIANRAL